MGRIFIILSTVFLVILLLVSGTLLVGNVWSEPTSFEDGTALSTAFTYQGSLTDNGQPAEGVYDFIFTLYSTSEEGNPIGSSVEIQDLTVSSGLFTVELDFELGTILYDGSAYWLEISVRPGDELGLFTKLSPRQPLTSTPYAAYAARTDWSGLFDIPPGFDDGIDDDTLAGLGCSASQIPRYYGASWVCSSEEGDITGVNSGPGLAGGGSTGNVTLSLVESYRLPQGCENGEIPEWTGSLWRCSLDDVGDGGGGGDITGVVAGYGLEGGGLEGTITLDVFSGTIQTRISGICSPGSAVRSVNQDGTVNCETDNDTLYSAGKGLDLSGVTLTITSTYRLPQECNDGEIARWDHENLIWTCDADLDTTDDVVTYDEIAGIVGTGSEMVAAGDHQHGSEYAALDHAHDDRYFTQNELVGGTAQVDWANLANLPTGINDGDDDSLAALPCADEQIVKRVGGVWSCGSDEVGGGGNIGDITAVYGGAGLSGNAESGDVTLEVGAGAGIETGLDSITIAPSYRLPQSCTTGQLANWNGSGWSCADPGSSAVGWSLTGNAGTTPGSNFLGTTDNQALEVRVNNLRALLLEPAAGSINVVAGYGGNSGNGTGATIGGGGRDLAINQAGGDYSSVAGGADNSAAGYGSAVGGGESNSAAGSYASSHGGFQNLAGGDYTAVGGGQNNSAGGNYAVIGGGQSNVTNQPLGTIAGGANNTTSAGYGTVGGGAYNEVSGAYGTIGGGGPEDTGNPTTSNNRVLDDYGTVSGGGGNVSGSDNGDPGDTRAATVSGGMGNSASASYATSGGGYQNIADGFAATVAGGAINAATANYATVSGGNNNAANANYSAVGSGRANTAGGAYATIVGGMNNMVTGAFGAIPGGLNNYVGGNYGFAAGFQARAEHPGSFVWSDSQGGVFSSTGANQFLIDASGGVGIGTSSPAHTLTVEGDAAIRSSEVISVGAIFHQTLQAPRSLYAVGDLLYASSYATNTLSIWNVPNPASQDLIGYTTFQLRGPVDLQVVGSRAYLASQNRDMLTILDVSDPSDPSHVGDTTEFLDHPQGVHVNGKYAYVASQGNDGRYDGLTIFDITDAPAEIAATSFITTYLDGTSDVYVLDRYAYVTSRDNHRLVVFDISDPRHPAAVGFIEASLIDPVRVSVTGIYAFVVDDGGDAIVVYDISHPAEPVFLGKATNDLLTHPRSIYLSGERAFVAYAGDEGTNMNCGLGVFDISNPIAVTLLNTIDMSDWYRTEPEYAGVPPKPVVVTGSGDRIYVANERQDSVTIFEIDSLEASAIQTGELQTSQLEVTDHAAVEGNLAVRGGLNVGLGGALIQGALTIEGEGDSIINGRLGIGPVATVITRSVSPTESEEIILRHPTHQLDVGGEARFRVNDHNHIVIRSPNAGSDEDASIDFVGFGYPDLITPTSRIEFDATGPMTQTTSIRFYTQGSEDSVIRSRFEITSKGDVIPGADGEYMLGIPAQRWHSIYAVNGTIQTSDVRLKENIASLGYGLTEINQLRPVSFSWKEDPDRERHYGLIAQEVLELLPEMVDLGQEPGDSLGLNYAELTPVLVSAIQEQQKQIENQAEQIATLEGRLTALENGENSLFSHFNPLWAGALVAVALVFVGSRRWPGG